jgi:hypothetical protein
LERTCKNSIVINLASTDIMLLLQAPMGVFNPFLAVNLAVIVVCVITFSAIVGVLAKRKLI